MYTEHLNKAIRKKSLAKSFQDVMSQFVSRGGVRRVFVCDLEVFVWVFGGFVCAFWVFVTMWMVWVLVVCFSELF